MTIEKYLNDRFVGTIAHWKVEGKLHKVTIKKISNGRAECEPENDDDGQPTKYCIELSELVIY